MVYFLKKLRKFVILLIVIVVACIPFVLSRDWFQKQIFPRRFWSNKINYLNWSIENNTRLLKHAKIDLEKEKSTYNLSIEQEMLLHSDESDKPITREDATINVNFTIQQLEEDIKTYENELRIDYARLNEAKLKFESCK